MDSARARPEYRYRRTASILEPRRRPRFLTSASTSLLNFVYDLDCVTHALNKWPKRLTAGWQLSGIYTLGSGLADHSVLERRGAQRQRRNEQRPA